MKAILNINGKDYSIQEDSSMPLLWIIRDSVGLTGTKYGCGKGLCGACTVLVDNESVRSCSTSIDDVLGKSIVTIEGIENKVLKEVWEQLNVPQCGFCQSGQIVSATALLKKTPHPTSLEIDDAMKGNICRCGTYSRIKKAILQTSKMNK